MDQGFLEPVDLVSFEEKLYARKSIKIKTEDVEQQVLCEREAQILQKINCSYIIKLCDQEQIYFQNKNRIYNYFIFEYCKYGDLFNYMINNYSVDNKICSKEKQVRYILYQLVKGLKYLRDNLNIVHCDLKPDNILITKISSEGPIVKITDFGLACKENEWDLLASLRGSLAYLAPECFFSVLGKRGYASDVWALGLIFYQLLEFFLPVSIDKENLKDINNTLRRKLRIISKAAKVEEIKWSQEARDFYSQMMSFHPKNRLNYDEILNHPWMKEVKIQSLCV